MKYTEKDVEHWQTIIASVFKAEDAIKGQQLLSKLGEKYGEDVEKIADEYTKAIAEEILKNTLI